MVSLYESCFKSVKIFFLLYYLAAANLSFADSDTMPPPPDAEARWQADWKDAAVLGFNMAASCAISGFGARSHGKTFKYGCIRGALISGPLIYAGQKMGAYAPFYPGLAHIAIGVHSLGVSIRDNIAEGIGWLDRYQWNYGPIQFSLGDPKINNGRAINAYVLPLPLAGLIYGFAAGDPDIRMSLKMGIPVFQGDLSLAERLNGIGPVDGVALPNVIVLHRDIWYANYTMSHEFTHGLQYRELSFLDQVFERKKFFKRARQKYHVKLGADIGALGLQVFGVIPHEWRPIEWAPNALEIKPEAPPKDATNIP